MLYHNTNSDTALLIINDGFIKPMISSWAGEKDLSIKFTTDKTEYLMMIQFEFDFNLIKKKFELYKYNSGFEHAEYRIKDNLPLELLNKINIFKVFLDEKEKFSKYTKAVVQLCKLKNYNYNLI